MNVTAVNYCGGGVSQQIYNTTHDLVFVWLKLFLSTYFTVQFIFIIIYEFRCTF